MVNTVLIDELHQIAVITLIVFTYILNDVNNQVEFVHIIYTTAVHKTFNGNLIAIVHLM